MNTIRRNFAESALHPAPCVIDRSNFTLGIRSETDRVESTPQQTLRIRLQILIEPVEIAELSRGVGEPVCRVVATLNHLKITAETLELGFIGQHPMDEQPALGVRQLHHVFVGFGSEEFVVGDQFFDGNPRDAFAACEDEPFESIAIDLARAGAFFGMMLLDIHRQPLGDRYRNVAGSIEKTGVEGELMSRLVNERQSVRFFGVSRGDGSVRLAKIVKDQSICVAIIKPADDALRILARERLERFRSRERNDGEAIRGLVNLKTLGAEVIEVIEQNEFADRGRVGPEGLGGVADRQEMIAPGDAKPAQSRGLAEFFDGGDLGGIGLIVRVGGGGFGCARRLKDKSIEMEIRRPRDRDRGRPARERFQPAPARRYDRAVEGYRIVRAGRRHRFVGRGFWHASSLKRLDTRKCLYKPALGAVARSSVERAFQADVSVRRCD